MAGALFLSIILMIVLLFIGTPVAVSLCVGGAAGLYMVFGISSLSSVALLLGSTIDNFLILAIPLFIVMGVILGKSGVGEKLYVLFDAYLRHIPGGIGVATILTCAVLAAMCGTSVAIAAMVGAFAFENLKKYGYSLHLSIGIIAAGGALGILIPPSVPMIVYSAFSDESTAKLFISGIIPGVLAIIFFSCYVMIIHSKGMKRVVSQKATLSERIKATKDGVWALLVPAGVMIPLYTGIATPTETAAIGIFWSFFIGIVIYRKITYRDILPILEESVTSSVMILFVISGALIFGNAATQLGLSNMIISAAAESLSAFSFILLTIGIVLVLGMFLEGASIMFVILPIVLPTLLGLHVDLIWYAVVLVICIEIALLTPPVGLNLYAVDGMAKSFGYPSNMSVAIKGSSPFMLLYLAVLVLLLFFPKIATWLPLTIH